MSTTINSREFVVAWVDAFNKGNGVNGVASKLNLNTTQVSAKANNLRRQGVKLPPMPRVHVGYNIDSLNQLIADRVKS